MTFSIRDSFWLILVICTALGCWRTSSQRTEERIHSEIRQRGYFDDRKWMAVMFPIRDENGKQDRMLRVYTTPTVRGNAAQHSIEVMSDGNYRIAYLDVGRNEMNDVIDIQSAPSSPYMAKGVFCP